MWFTSKRISNQPKRNTRIPSRWVPHANWIAVKRDVENFLACRPGVYRSRNSGCLSSKKGSAITCNLTGCRDGGLSLSILEFPVAMYYAMSRDDQREAISNPHKPLSHPAPTTSNFRSGYNEPC